VDDLVAGAVMSDAQQSKTAARSRFKPGQSVRLSRDSPYRNAVAGDYKVVCELPSRDGEAQYRIKSSNEPHERVVKEGELERA
jgi:hypothetical protein